MTTWRWRTSRTSSSTKRRAWRRTLGTVRQSSREVSWHSRADKWNVSDNGRVCGCCRWSQSNPWRTAAASVTGCLWIYWFGVMGGPASVFSSQLNFLYIYRCSSGYSRVSLSLFLEKSIFYNCTLIKYLPFSFQLSFKWECEGRKSITVKISLINRLKQFNTTVRREDLALG